MTGPPPYPMYSAGHRPPRGRDYPRDLPRRGRTPPGYDYKFLLLT